MLINRSSDSQRPEDAFSVAPSYEFDHKTEQPKVLIVDDSVFNVLALKGAFEQLQFSCDASNGGEDAVQVIKDQVNSGRPVYKLIMMDYSMPDINGPEASKRIREFLTERGIPRKSQPYICLLTAYSGKKYHENALEAGMD